MLQRRQVYAANIPIDPYHGGQSCRQMEVGSALLGAEREQLGDIHANPCLAILFYYRSWVGRDSI
jgi:hypothetical protein